jgi:hypothetical protein
VQMDGQQRSNRAPLTAALFNGVTVNTVVKVSGMPADTIRKAMKTTFLQPNCSHRRP